MEVPRDNPDEKSGNHHKAGDPAILTLPLKRRTHSARPLAGKSHFPGWRWHVVPHGRVADTLSSDLAANAWRVISIGCLFATRVRQCRFGGRTQPE